MKTLIPGILSTLGGLKTDSRDGYQAISWMFIKSISSPRCSKWYCDIYVSSHLFVPVSSIYIKVLRKICQDSKNALQVELHIFPCAWAWGQPQKELKCFRIFGGNPLRWGCMKSLVATPRRTTKFMIEASSRIASGNTLELLHQKGKSPKKTWP